MFLLVGQRDPWASAGTVSVIALVGLLIGLVRLSPAIGAMTFTTVGPYPSGQAADFRTSGVAIADLDRDGIADLAVTNFGPNSQPPYGNTSVLWGNSAGGFGAPQSLRDEITNGVRAGDLDGDGNPDLVIGDGHGTRIFWGNGTRSFNSPEVLSNVAVGGVTLADVDKNSLPDVLVTEYPDEKVAVFYNQGARSFSAQRYHAGPDVNSSPAIGDLDGQNGLDLVVTHFWANKLSVLLANGAGGFAPPATRDAGQLPSGVGVGEFNGDSNPDVIYARRGCNADADTSCANDGVTLLTGDGSGVFGSSQDFVVGDGPSALAVTDIDDNGTDDVVVVNFNSNSVSLLLGQPGGGLLVEGPIPVDRGPIDLAIGDINRDGCKDIVTANWRSATVSVLLIDCSDISGRIRYYSADRPVADVTVQALGPVQHSTMSDQAGSFSLAGLDEADWTIEPTKVGGRGEAISTLDASYVLQRVAGLRTFSPLQSLACDVTGNGTISPLDAVRILQYVAGQRSRLEVADACGSDWGFMPMGAVVPNQTVIPPLMTPGTCQRGAVQFEPLEGVAASQDFLGFVFGDCTGNWLPESPVGALRH